MDTVDMFYELFSGNREVYGRHIPEGSPTEGEKAKGKSFTVRDPVTRELHANHLLGKESIGIVPIDKDGKISFCAIDVDVYPLRPHHYIHMITKFNLPLCPFRSKSGGLHLFLFFSEPCDARKGITSANKLRQAIGLPSDTEVFPKQAALAEGATGNWINIPYFGKSRYMYGDDAKPLSQEDGIALAWERRRTLAQVQETIAQLPFNPAPPCLQAMYICGAASAEGRNRNTFMFNTAVYLKSRYGEEFPIALKTVNRMLDVPLQESELETTVIRSHAKNSYTYQCNDAGLKGFCDKEECKCREFGKGGSSISEFIFEQLTQFMTDPPYYVWTVNGSDMVFYSESALRDQGKFADYAMRILHKVPNQIKQEKWNDILRTAFSNIATSDAEGEDMTEKTLLSSYVSEFILDRALPSREALITGMVYEDKQSGRYYFRGDAFLKFLTDSKRFTFYKPREVMSIVKELYKANPTIIRLPSGKTTRCWEIKFPEFRKAMNEAIDELEEGVGEEVQSPSGPMEDIKDFSQAAKNLANTETKGSRNAPSTSSEAKF